MKTVTTLDNKNEMLNFIMINSSVLDNYDVKPLYQQTFISKLSKELGIHIEKNGSVDGITINTPETKDGFRFDFNKTIDFNISIFKGLLSSKGISWDEFKEFNKFNYFFNSSFFRELKDRENYYYCHGSEMFRMVMFLHYLITGTEIKSGDVDNYVYKQINGFDKPSHVYFGIEKLSTFEFKIGDVSIKRFVNGNLVIKTLSPEQKEKIKRFTKIREILKGLI